jgi:hypothetical protein
VETRSHGPQCTDESALAGVNGLIPREPASIRAFAFRWRRITVITCQDVPQVEMRVTLRSCVYVDMDQGRLCFGKPELEARFFDGLAPSAVPRRLICFNVTARLQPNAEALVFVEDNATRANHDRRAGDMDDVGILSEWVGESVEGFQECSNRLALTLIERVEFCDAASDVVAEFLRAQHPRKLPSADESKRRPLLRSLTMFWRPSAAGHEQRRPWDALWRPRSVTRPALRWIWSTFRKVAEVSQDER